jgi:hypothetical protein
MVSDTCACSKACQPVTAQLSSVQAGVHAIDLLTETAATFLLLCALLFARHAAACGLTQLDMLLQVNVCRRCQY